MTFFPVRRSTLALALSTCVFCLASQAADDTRLGKPTDGAATVSKAAPGIAGELLCAPGQDKALTDGFGWYDTGRGLTLGTVKAGQSCTLLATGAGLNVQFPGQSALLLSGPVNYRLGATPRSAEFSLAEPVLCESYYAGNDELAIQLTDTNLVQQTLRGFRRIDYTPGTARFVPEPVAGSVGSTVQCHAFPFASLIANPPSVPPPAPVNPDLIFRSGFDDGANLVLDLRTGDGALSIRQLDVARDQAFAYQIRVSNTGAVAASGVRVREFVPTNAQQSLIQPVVTSGAWTCSTGAAPCPGAASGTGVLNLSNLTIGAGETYIFTLSRTVSDGAPPDKTLLGAALFFDPQDTAGGGDRVLTDNSAPLILTLVPNQVPQFACSYPARVLPVDQALWVWNSDLPVNVVMDEAGAPVEFECRVRDLDAEAFTLAAAPTNTNPTLVPNAGLISSLGTGHFDVRIAPPSDQIGTALITQTATDVREGTGRVRINVEVRDVNAPPSFGLVSGVLSLYPGPFDGPVRDGSGALIDKSQYFLGTDCANSGLSICTVTFPSFLTNLSVGADPESPGQQLSAQIGNCQGSGLLPTQNPPTITAGPLSTSGQFELRFTHYKSQSGFFNPAAEVTCTITVTDTGSPPQATNTNLVFRYHQ